jgi:hypothetical protein
MYIYHLATLLTIECHDLDDFLMLFFAFETKHTLEAIFEIILWIGLPALVCMAEPLGGTMGVRHPKWIINK